MADTLSVSYLTQDMRGAPQISSTPGSLIAALDALLIDGWGLAPAQSITVAAGVATATFASASAFEVGAVIEIAGAAPAPLNGRARVLSSAGAVLTFATSAPDGAASGTMGIKYASAGWQKVFTGANKAVYRSQDAQSARHYLRVDDSGAQYARVRGFVSMSDIDTGLEPYPSDAIMSGGGYWWRSSYGASPVPYALAANGRFVLLGVAHYMGIGPSYGAIDVRGFGDPLALNPAGDAYASLLSYCGSDGGNFGRGGLQGAAYASDGYGAIAVARASTGLGAALLQGISPLTGKSGQLSGACDLMGRAPSAVDGQVKTSELFVADMLSGAPARARVPAMRYIPQAEAMGLLGAFARLDGAGAMAGRRLLALHCGTGAQPSGVALMDVTGPWA
jgi:hypothetical protein